MNDPSTIKFLDYVLLTFGDYELKVYHLLLVIIIILIINLLLTIARKIFKRFEKKRNMDIGKSHAIYQIVKYLTWIIGILLMLESINIKITFILASSAALLVGLGLGLQQLFQDFVSGITLLMEGTLKVGDIVQTENGEVGKVIEMGLRTSKLETRDKIILIVPNSKLIIDTVINWSHLDRVTRFSVNIGVAYGTDVEHLSKILLTCTRDIHEIAQKHEPQVIFSNFGESSLDFKILFWTRHTFQVEFIKSKLRFAVNKALKENGITIPFPQRDVHLKK